MTDYKLSAVHGLRSYMWRLLQDNLGWTVDDYADENGTKYVPIITPQQEKMFNEMGKPYIVYSFSRGDTGNSWFIENEAGAFSVFSSNEEDIRRVINLFQTKFNRRDDSANELNDYIQKNASAALKTFDYKTLWVSTVQGPQPSTEEGGRRDGLITINMKYTQTEFDEESNKKVN
jgi:hypothetical protein